MNRYDNHEIKHIGFILDGNGRWAKKRGLARNLGHKEGVNAVKRTIEACIKFNIKYVSLFCFSTENWKRSKSEVDGIFQLLEQFVDDEWQECVSNNIKVQFLGNLDEINKSLQDKILAFMDKTKDNNGIIVNILLNYGSRDEIVRAINLIISDKLDKIDYDTLRKYLYTNEIPDLDFVVRTSGEKRLSNFMLLQSAYSELYFPKVYWPSFNERWLKKCIKEFKKRNRRFGNV